MKKSMGAGTQPMPAGSAVDQIPKLIDVIHDAEDGEADLAVEVRSLDRETLE